MIKPSKAKRILSKPTIQHQAKNQLANLSQQQQNHPKTK